MFKKETLGEKEIRMREKEITIYYGENPWCSPPSIIGGGSVLKLVFHGGPIFFVDTVGQILPEVGERGGWWWM